MEGNPTQKYVSKTHTKNPSSAQRSLHCIVMTGKPTYTVEHNAYNEYCIPEVAIYDRPWKRSSKWDGTLYPLEGRESLVYSAKRKSDTQSNGFETVLGYVRALVPDAPCLTPMLFCGGSMTVNAKAALRKRTEHRTGLGMCVANAFNECDSDEVGQVISWMVHACIGLTHIAFQAYTDEYVPTQEDREAGLVMSFDFMPKAMDQYEFYGAYGAWYGDTLTIRISSVEEMQQYENQYIREHYNCANTQEMRQHETLREEADRIERESYVPLLRYLAEFNRIMRDAVVGGYAPSTDHNIPGHAARRQPLSKEFLERHCQATLRLLQFFTSKFPTPGVDAWTINAAHKDARTLRISPYPDRYALDEELSRDIDSGVAPARMDVGGLLRWYPHRNPATGTPTVHDNIPTRSWFLWVHPPPIKPYMYMLYDREPLSEQNRNSIRHAQQLWNDRSVVKVRLPRYQLRHAFPGRTDVCGSYHVVPWSHYWSKDARVVRELRHRNVMDYVPRSVMVVAFVYPRECDRAHLVWDNIVVAHWPIATDSNATPDDIPSDNAVVHAASDNQRNPHLVGMRMWVGESLAVRWNCTIRKIGAKYADCASESNATDPWAIAGHSEEEAQTEAVTNSAEYTNRAGDPWWTFAAASGPLGHMVRSGMLDWHRLWHCVPGFPQALLSNGDRMDTTTSSSSSTQAASPPTTPSHTPIDLMCPSLRQRVLQATAPH